MTWDESDSSASSNQVATIFYGANVVPGQHDTPYNHYNLLSTITQSFGLTAPNEAANAAPIQEVFAHPQPQPQPGVNTVTLNMSEDAYLDDSADRRQTRRAANPSLQRDGPVS